MLKNRNEDKIFFRPQNNANYLKSSKFGEKIEVYFTSNFQDVKEDQEGNNMAYQVSQNPELVLANRLKFSQEIDKDLDQFVFPCQTHSINSYKVTEKDLKKGKNSYDSGIPNVDCLYTFEPNIVLCAFFADCTPIYFWEEESGLIGIIHSGWQGTVNNISYEVLKKVAKAENINLANMKIIIGPSIKQKSFQIQKDVREQFLKARFMEEKMITKIDEKTWIMDTDSYNYNMLRSLGIKEKNIFISNIDTYETIDLFSYRRDEKTGRMIGVISKK